MSKYFTLDLVPQLGGQLGSISVRVVHHGTTSAISLYADSAWTKAALGDRVQELEGRIIEQIERQCAPQPKSFIPTWAQDTAPTEETPIEEAPLES